MQTTKPHIHISHTPDQEIFQVKKTTDPLQELTNDIVMKSPISVVNSLGEKIAIKAHQIHPWRDTLFVKTNEGLYKYDNGMLQPFPQQSDSGEKKENTKTILNTALLKDGICAYGEYNWQQNTGYIDFTYNDTHMRIDLSTVHPSVAATLRNLLLWENAHLLSQKDDTLYIGLSFGNCATIKMKKSASGDALVVQEFYGGGNKAHYWTASGQQITQDKSHDSSKYIIKVDGIPWQNSISSGHGYVKVRDDVVFAIDYENIYLQDQKLQLPESKQSPWVHDVYFDDTTKTWYVARGKTIYAGTSTQPASTIELPHGVHKIFVDASGDVACILWNGTHYLIRHKGFSMPMGTTNHDEADAFTFDPETNTFTGNVTNPTTSEKSIVSYTLNPNAREVHEQHTREEQEKQTKAEILVLLDNEGIKSLEAMKKLILAAQEKGALKTKYDTLFKDIVELGNTNRLLESKIISLEKDKGSLGNKVQNLQNTIDNIKRGIAPATGMFSKGTYTITQEAKNELNL